VCVVKHIRDNRLVVEMVGRKKRCFLTFDFPLTNLWYCVSDKRVGQNLRFFLFEIIFLNYFNILILKIKKYHFDIFPNEKHSEK
jgi:hypothetical protein